MQKAKHIIIFGPPGCGKGTQSKNIIEYFNVLYLSTGDILREEMSKQTPLGKKAKDFIDNGKLVTDSLINQMVQNKVLATIQKQEGILYDGYPRTLQQAIFIDEVLAQVDMSIHTLIYLHVKREELIKRILGRGQTSGRSDDTHVDTIQKRLDEYEAKTLPIKKHYEKKGIAHEVNGEYSIEKIFDEIKNILMS